MSSLFRYLFFILCLPLFTHSAHANYSLLGVSDLLSSSEPSATSTTHTITFTVPNGVPLGGKIVIKPDGTGFDFPSGMDFTDVDFATAPASVGPFTDRPLAASAAVFSDGVAVVTGAGGSVTITLGDVGSGAIAASSTVKIELGVNATYGTAGTRNITSPSGVGSYRIRIDTFDAASVPIDDGTAMVAIIEAVTIFPVATPDLAAPVRSNGRPSGLLPGSTVAVQIVLNTDQFAFCRYTTTASTSYSAMTNNMSYTTDQLTHYATVSGLTQQTSYTYYVRCSNGNGSAINDDDYAISFQVGAVPLPGVASGPSGSGGGGGNFLQPVSEVLLDGKTFPGGTLVVMRDGSVVLEGAVDSSGGIRASFQGLERGTYTWGVYAKDPAGKRTATYNSTIFLIAKTANVIAPIYLSPTVSASTTVEVGEDVTLTGYAIANTPVEAIMNQYGNATGGTVVTASSTASGAGKYALTLPTEGLAKGTYEVKARSLISARDASNFSPVIYVGIGQDPIVDFSKRADLNKDGKVNLTDFSILLFNWKGSDATADINQDGTVNLTDFSIMLSNWTG